MKPLLALAVLTPAFAAELRIATFRADATPDMGEPLIWVMPVTKVEDPLWAKGIIIDDGNTRYVLCALDWCGIGGTTHRLFREKIAQAARTEVSRVMVQTVHQHSAPYIIGDAYRLFDNALRMSDGYLNKVTAGIARAVREARFEPFDRVGTGEAAVEQVASERRLMVNGKALTRYSGSGKDPKMAAYPEGDIDRNVKTITFARGSRAIVRLHFYATHPQTFCCDGRVSADIVGAAREALEREQKIFQVYFTGCAGNVTAGKYNDGSAAARERLAARLHEGLQAASAATRFAPAAKPVWRNVPLQLAPKPAPANSARDGAAVYRAAITRAFAARQAPLDTASLEIGPARMLFLPGEPMLVFQKYAQRFGGFVAVAGYGDIMSGYLVTDRAYQEGGYEPSASNALPGAEARLKQVIDRLLGRTAP